MRSTALPDPAVPQGRRALRIETVVNSPDDLRCHRRLQHLPVLQTKARDVNARLLDTERVGQGCVLASPAFERVALPSIIDSRRASALRFGDPRVMALLGALCYVRYMSTRDADTADRSGWLLVSVSTGSAATLRVHVWRQLRKLGAVYVQQSVCLLPDVPLVAKAVTRLVARVRDQGGQARVLHLRLTEPGELEQLVAAQRADRDAEYAEVVERTPAFLAELEHETACGRATYVEVEESEADLERFDRWLAAIAARDYFDAAGGAAARSAVEGCRTALATFEQAALAADTAADTADTGGAGGADITTALVATFSGRKRRLRVAEDPGSS